MNPSSRVLLFTFFEFVNKGVPFLLLPILTRYLTPYDYGVIVTFTMFTSFFAIFIGLSGHGAVDANYFKIAKKRLAIYISNVIFILSCSFLLMLFAVLFANRYIEERFGIPLVWQSLALLVSFSQFVTLINLTLWVIEKKPLNYGLYQTSQTVFLALISLTAVVAYNLTWIGHLTAIVISASSFAIASIYFLCKRGYLKIKIRKLYIKDFLMFAIPMMPHQLGDWFRTQGDKIIIVTFIGGAALGIYGVGQQLALVMLILITSLNKALYPSLFKALQAKPCIAEKSKIVKKTYVLALAIAVMGVFGVFLTPILYPFIVGGNFQSAALVTQLIIVAMIFEAFYYLVVNYIFYKKQTKGLAKITFSMAILHILLSFVLVVVIKFDYHVIAYSMVCSSLIQFLLVWRFSNSVYPMPWLSFFKVKF